MITLADVAVSFGSTDVLEGVDLSVDAGRLVGLVGPNGAGKTTLLRTVNGVVAPDAGAVRVDGTDVGGRSAREIGRRVATVPQETTLAFSFSVREVVAMGRTPYRSRFGTASDVDREHVDRALERTATTRFADRPVDELSGGQRQRVILARALCQDAPVLLLDEPTGSLDINHQVATFELVRSLVAEGRTVLAAIHDLDLAARYCDELALLADGRVLAHDAPEAVLRSDLLDDAFGVETAVAPGPVTGTPTVTALSDRPARDERVHVVGTGPRTARLVAALWRAGYRVSVGVLPAGDVAAERAAHLDCPTVTAPPFGPVEASTRERARERVRAADATVVVGDPLAANREVVAAAPSPILVPSSEGATASGPDDGDARDGGTSAERIVAERADVVQPPELLEAVAAATSSPPSVAGD